MKVLAAVLSSFRDDVAVKVIALSETFATLQRNIFFLTQPPTWIIKLLEKINLSLLSNTGIKWEKNDHFRLVFVLVSDYNSIPDDYFKPRI
jgi:hypothetical protein